MSSISQRIIRTIQPQSPTGINWSNPIAQGLIDVIDFSTPVPRSLILNTPATKFGSPAYGASPLGVGMDTTSGGGGWYFQRSDGAYTTPAVSHVAVAVYSSGTGSYAGLFSTSDGPGTNGAFAIQEGATPSDGSISINNTPNPTTGLLTNTWTGKQQVAIATANATSAAFYNNGVLAPNGSISGTALNTYSTSRLTVFGERTASSGYATLGKQALHLVFNRALTSAEIASLSANPWQIFAPISQPIFVAQALTVVTINGSISATEATDTSTISGNVVVQGNISASESNDSIAIVSPPATSSLRARLPLIRTTQPGAPTGINYSNPITRGLVIAYLPGFGYDATGNIKTIGSPLSDTRRVGGSITSTTDMYSYNGMTVSNGQLLGPLTNSTIFSTYSVPAGFSTWNAGRSIYAERGYGYDIYKIGINSSGSMSAEFTYRNDSGALSQQFNHNAALNDGKTHALAATKSGQSLVSYFDGTITTGTFGTTDYSFTDANNQIRIGSDTVDGGANFVGTINVVLGWNRALSLAELNSLRDNPWQVFAPIQQFLLAPPVVATSSGSITATESNDTLLVQGSASSASFKLPTRRRISQPQGSTRIDWSNPITRGLLSAANAASADDIVSNSSIIPSPATQTGIVANQAGLGFTTTVNGEWQLATKPALGTGDFTVFSIAQCTNPATTQVLASQYDAAADWFLGAVSGVWKFECATASVTSISGPTGKVQAIAGVRKSGNIQIYTGGTKDGASAAAAGNISAGTVYSIGNFSTLPNYPFQGSINLVLLFNRALSDSEIASLTANPWQVFAPVSNQSFFSTAPISSIGSIAVTESLDTVAVSGNTLIQGSIASTDVTDTIASTGSAPSQGSITVTDTADSILLSGYVTVQGTEAGTEANDTILIGGNVLIQGSITGTDSVDSISTSGNVLAQGSITVSESSSDSIAINGNNAATGSIATTDATDTIVVSGSVVVQGSITKTETIDTVAITGNLFVQGSINATDSNDIISVNGSLIVQGTESGTEANDTIAIAAVLLVQGSVAATDAIDTGIFSGSNASAGNVAVTDVTDSLSASGVVAVFGSVTITESIDSVAVAGILISQGSIASTDIIDTIVVSGSAGSIGNIAVTDVTDTMVVTGILSVNGNISVADLVDTANVIGAAVVNGAISATDNSDIINSSGNLNVQGNVSTTDIVDTSSISGATLVQGYVAATDNSDSIVSIGSLLSQGFVSVTETFDVGVFSGSNNSTGSITITELLDSIQISSNLLVNGSASLNDSTDSISSIGHVTVTGFVGSIESSDAFVVIGNLIVSGYLNSSDSSDTIYLIGSHDLSGTISTTESGVDVIHVSAATGNSGNISIIETNDWAYFTSKLPIVDITRTTFVDVDYRTMRVDPEYRTTAIAAEVRSDSIDSEFRIMIA